VIHTSRVLLPVIVASVLLVGRAGAEPAFLENYKAGLDAIEAEDWQRAVELMQLAIRERGEESRRLAKFLYLKPYLPYFYLGLAEFKRGDCQGADRFWSVSERQGVVQKRPQYEQIGLARELCRTRRTARSTVPGPSAASPAAPSTRTQPITQPAAPPRSTAAETRPAPARRPEAGERAPVRGSETPPPATVEDFGFTPQRIEVPADPPDDTLLEAAAALFDGEYQKIVDRLSEELPADPYARAQAHLLLAAAEFALYQADAERDADRLDSAREHVLAVRGALPELEPPERYFSPRFLDFFYGQRPQEVR